jgi:hypothetical protein
MVSNSPSIKINKELAVVGLGSITVGALLWLLLWSQLQGALLGLAVMASLGYAIVVAKRPKWGFYSVYAFTFWMFALGLYSGLPQLGVIADAMLLGNALIILFRRLYDGNLKDYLSRSKSLWIWAFWLIFSVGINLVHFNEVNWMSFIYGVRRFHLNPFGFILLNLLVIKDKSDFYEFLKVTFVFASISMFVGYRQFFIGLNATENLLLQGEFGITHRIQGIIRYWSSYSDAASYGIVMSLYAVLAITVALVQTKRSKRNWLLVFAIISVHHVLISGTRTALAVVAISLLLLLIIYLKGPQRIGIGFLGAGIYALLRFTTLGGSIGLIQRARSLFNPDDASLLLRLANRQELTVWLQGRALGGGIGGTLFDRQFAPETYLASFPPDGLYVKFRSEMGYAGEYMYGLLSILILIYMVYQITKTNPNGERRLWMVTILALTIGARLSEYAQFVTFQFPLANILFFSFVAFERWEHWEDPEVLDTSKKVPLL